MKTELLQSIANIESQIAALRATVEALPSEDTPPAPKLWEISIEANRNAACETNNDGTLLPSPFSLDAGGSLGAALAQNGWPNVETIGTCGARCLSVTPPQSLSVIYTGAQNPDTGEWSYEPAVTISWNEVAA